MILLLKGFPSCPFVGHKFPDNGTICLTNVLKASAVILLSSATEPPIFMLGVFMLGIFTLGIFTLGIFTEEENIPPPVTFCEVSGAANALAMLVSTFCNSTSSRASMFVGVSLALFTSKNIALKFEL